MGQHAYTVWFSRLFCIVPFFFSSSPSSKCSSLLCRSTFLTIQFSTGRFWTNFSANHPDSGWLAHIRQHNLCCTLLKEITCKRNSWESNKSGKNVAFCVFEDSKSNFVTQRLHSHFNWVFSLDSVERNGKQKAFLGQLQKWENSCFVWVYEDSTSNFVNRHSPFSFVGQNAYAVSLQSLNSHLKNLFQRLFKLNLQCVMLLTEKPLFDWNQTFRAAPKSGISRIEWRRKFESNHSRICSKSCSNSICSPSCFRERNHFLTEIKPSELQIWHLENRMNKKIWHNSFKKLLQKLFKLKLQCFMLSREKPLFDWN